MKRILYITPILFIIVCCDIVTGTVKFTKTFGGDEGDKGYSVQQTVDGGYILVGTTGSFAIEQSSIWLIKTDSKGEEEWNRTIGGGISPSGKFVQQTTDGGFIITGYTNFLGNGSSDLWLIKTDANGNEIWNRTFGGSGWDKGQSVQQTDDDGFIITGYTSSFGNGGLDVYLIKTDSEGNEVWSQTFGGDDIDCGYYVQQTNSGGYIITGYTESYGNGQSDVWVIKTDANGNDIWNRTFGGIVWDEGRSVHQTDDGGFIISGFTWVVEEQQTKVWLIKLGSRGNEEWNKTIGGNRYTKCYSLQPTDDNGFIITGSSWNRYSDVFLSKTDSEGNELWNQTFGGSDDDVGYSVQQTSDGGYIVLGYTDSFGHGNSDLWLIKTNPLGFVSCGN